MALTTRTLLSEDVDVLAEAFNSWPKPRELFVEYCRRLGAGDLDVVIADLHGQAAGFLIIAWESSYPPFAASGIPEIGDVNVLPYARRQGVGTALMDEAERRAGHQLQ